MATRRSILLLMVAVTLLLSLVVVAPAGAHGGEEGTGPASVGSWMVGLIYLQVTMIPIVGLWLAGQALDAWRPFAGDAKSKEG